MSSLTTSATATSTPEERTSAASPRFVSAARRTASRAPKYRCRIETDYRRHASLRRPYEPRIEIALLSRVLVSCISRSLHKSRSHFVGCQGAPSEKRISGWIEKAKALKPLISH